MGRCRDECPAEKAEPRGCQARKRYSGVLEEMQAKQKKTFNFEILRVFACKMDPVLSSHFIDLAIFPKS